MKMKKTFKGIIPIIIIALLVLSHVCVAQEEQSSLKPVKTSDGGAKSGSSKGTGVTMFSLANIKRGEVKEFSINKKALPVDKISFKSLVNYVGDMEIYIKRTFPSKTFTKLDDAHSYFEINTVNFDSGRFRDFRIEFTLQKSWLMVRKLNDSEVSLYRLVDGVWNKLPTNLLRVEGNNKIYSALTPGFSYFAISKSGLEQKNIVEANDTNEIIIIEEIVNESSFEEETENIVEAISTIYQEESDLKSVWKKTIYHWILLGLILMAFYFLGKKSRKKI